MFPIVLYVALAMLPVFAQQNLGRPSTALSQDNATIPPVGVDVRPGHAQVAKPPKTEEELAIQRNKYFHEPGDVSLNHYDARYFQEVLSYEDRADTLTHMIRAYLTIFRELGLETWLAHGTLLGWWWNGKILPWDLDIDTQVSEATLARMARHYNHTFHEYILPDDVTSRKYLLDVNPWSWQRERGDGANIIDARWIDMRNGMYVDITALTKLDPNLHQGIWSCKAFHHYRTGELFPMRESTYEGVQAQVPYDYDRILIDEYGLNALVKTEFHGHKWDDTRKEWVRV